MSQEGDRTMLEVKYAGLKLKNPIIVASATPTINYDNWKRCEAAGAAAFVPKSMIFSKKLAPDQKFTPGERTGFNLRPRFKMVNKDDTSFDPNLAKRGAMYYLLAAGEKYPLPEEFAKEIEKGKKEISIPIIASICGGEKQYEEWAKLAKIAESAGADAIELNMHHMPVNNYTDPQVLKTVKESVKIPVIGKTMAPWENPAEQVTKLEAAGADAIATMGHIRFRGLDVDPEEEKIPLAPIFLGVTGPIYGPLALAILAQTCQVAKVPVSGVSGLMSWRSAVKNILLGATTVQVCTAIYQDGYGSITKMVQGLEDFMKRKDYKSIEDFRGKVLKTMVPPTVLPDEPPIKAAVDEEKCIGCGQCAEVCMYSAVGLKEDLASIDQMKCDGCGLCVSICPVKAIAMQNVG
jgi:dihydroorotate dehydrogenase/NAD-dependent dihydropyrimidine dehydrogenase PreA subunit